MSHFHPLYSVFVTPSHVIVTIWYNVIIFYCFSEFRYNKYRPNGREETLEWEREETLRLERDKTPKWEREETLKWEREEKLK